MKRALLALMILLTAGVCLVALSDIRDRRQEQLQASQAAKLRLTGELAELKLEQVGLAEKVGDLKGLLQQTAGARSIDPELADILLTNNLQFASSQMQDQVLASFGLGGNSSGTYVLVSKATLTNCDLKPLENFPNHEKLTEAVRGVLAITPEERKPVEAAFAEAFDSITSWARANVQREGAGDGMLVRYTIPTDATFSQSVSNKLFSNISTVIGSERAELMREFFQIYRIYEDGYIGERTNIFSIHRIAAPPGYGYRAGWKMHRSEAINTDPEPIKPSRFPNAFFFVFPGGWQELAQREGFTLPEEFQNKSNQR